MPNLSKYAKVPQGKIPISILIGFTSAGFLIYFARQIFRRSTPKQGTSGIKISPQKKAQRVSVDMKFLKNVYKLLRIAVPGFFTMEMFYLIIVAIGLLARTYSDLWIISNGTAIESSIIDRNPYRMKKNLTKFIIAMPIISIINNILKYGTSECKIRFRKRITDCLFASYLHKQTYYKMSNIDNRISNADQLLTQDIEKFSDTLAELYSNLSQPILNIILFSSILARNVGIDAPFNVLVYMVISGIFLTVLRRPVGGMTAREQQLEGEFRYVNSRIITNSEEIAFYQGDDREKETVDTYFSRLISHLRELIGFHLVMGFIDHIVAKYMATTIGYLSVSIPFMDLTTVKFLNASPEKLREDYYMSGRHLVRLAQAVGRLVLAGREMTRLAGYTQRVIQLRDVMLELEHGKYERTMIQPKEGEAPLIPGSGRIITQDRVIRFEGVPLVTPNGDCLVRSLDFEVTSGMNVLVCGPNGCGKSSLFRILGELWPLFGGQLTKPHRSNLFYIPQRPYMTIGTFRDQLIYPDTQVDMEAKGVNDNDLMQYLEQVQLTNLLEREDGWDAIHDWMDVLSGGEKQRVAMARLFYHHPQFAILDECTSAVSMDVEASMYQHCRKEGITLFTVSHRKSLWQHHEYVIQFDSRGDYEFKKIDEATDEFGT
ncbi:hypothetical protein LOD99_15324 [Oopsacas minuta]|uniref:ATP-binding cassette sub-family D member 3 n=1 Tax=Oopsacas minuta TaxID=111878 RepID=A0AAV7KD51_9METZ|nr:hypothetical protein LOD99_15324 [Oopsacas minuta]